MTENIMPGDEHSHPNTDKAALTHSQAGMRLIAQTSIYNAANWARLGTYITENYHPDALAEMDAETRVLECQTDFHLGGRVRVVQVIGIDPHHAVVILEAEKGELYFMDDITVEADYPHRILTYDHVPMEPDDEDGADEGA